MTKITCHCERFCSYYYLVILSFILLYMYEYFAHIDSCVSCACLVSREVRRGYQILGTRLTDGCELLCGCWKSIPGPRQEQVLFPLSHLSSPGYGYVVFYCLMVKIPSLLLAKFFAVIL